jgi:class 3 adenylate cyclase
MAQTVTTTTEADREAGVDRAGTQDRRRRRLLVHLAVDGVLASFMVVFWLLATGDAERNGVKLAGQGFWPAWLLLPLGLLLGAHAVYVLARGPLLPPAPGPRARAPAPPAGGRRMATVVFIDIVGSTEQAERLGDQRWGDLLDLHDSAAREAVGRWRGRVVKLTGDGVLAAFDGPERAIRCALALRGRLAAAGLQTRTGLHTGEVVLRGDDLGGIAVHIGARVMASAGRGEILVSRTVHDLVAGTDLAFEDRGEHELKGVHEPWRLFALRA